MFVEDAMDNVWENGVLVVWNIDPTRKDGCSSCIGRCDDKSDRTMEYKGKKYKLKEAGEMKQKWQHMNFAAKCFRPSTVQDR